MDFLELQRSWQQQATPAATPAAPAAAGLLAEVQRLHRLGRRRNRLASVLIGLAVTTLVGHRFLTFQSLTPTQALGLLLLTGALLGYVALMWWGTALGRRARPDLDNQTFVQATLRSFHFRRRTLPWLAVPYLLGFGTGLWLLNENHLTTAPTWQPALGLVLMVGGALWGRRAALRKYEQEFGATERELLRWQQSWQSAQ